MYKVLIISLFLGQLLPVIGYCKNFAKEQNKYEKLVQEEVTMVPVQPYDLLIKVKKKKKKYYIQIPTENGPIFREIASRKSNKSSKSK